VPQKPQASKKQHCCKIGRIADKYDVTPSVVGGDIDEGLLDRWLGRHGHPEMAVRSLVTWFNLKVLKKAYSDANREATEARVRTDYNPLTSNEDDDLQWDIERSLKEDGIDPDKLKMDFISSSTLHRHFKNCLNEKKGRKEAETDWEKTKVAFSKEKAADQIEGALQSWDNKNELPGGKEANVEIGVRLSCPVCSTSVPLSVALQRGYICEDHLGASEES